MSSLELPEDCIGHIMSFLSHPSDLVNAARVCRKWLSSARSDTIWKPLYAQYYGASGLLLPEIDPVAEKIESVSFSADLCRSLSGSAIPS
jgi:hypothetical protein